MVKTNKSYLMPKISKAPDSAKTKYANIYKQRSGRWVIRSRSANGKWRQIGHQRFSSKEKALNVWRQHFSSERFRPDPDSFIPNYPRGNASRRRRRISLKDNNKIKPRTIEEKVFNANVNQKHKRKRAIQEKRRRQIRQKNACINIQRIVRGMIQRIKCARLRRQHRREKRRADRQAFRERLASVEKTFTAWIYAYVIRQSRYDFSKRCLVDEERPIYVGQTNQTLEVRDYQHRRQNSTHFDRALKTEGYKSAEIKLVEQLTASTSHDIRELADRKEHEYIMAFQTLRGNPNNVYGLNTNNVRHYQRHHNNMLVEQAKLKQQLKLIDFKISQFNSSR